MRKVGRRIRLFSVGILAAVLLMAFQSAAQDEDAGMSESGPAHVTLEKAVMCEGLDDLQPVNSAVAFPISIGTVYCLTSFDSVSQKTYIYHHWFRKDNVSTRIRLALNPPRWSTYSSVRLREEDKGPWRVEIRDESNNLLKTLRFSITD